MMELLSETHPVARKTYRCDASEYVRDACNQGIFTIAEYRKIIKVKRNGWKIQPGQRYIKQVVVDGGTIFTYRALAEMECLCQKYDLFPES